MIGIADSILRTGLMCLLIGLLAGCARLGFPVSQQNVTVAVSDATDDATGEGAVAEEGDRDGKQRREAAARAFEAKRDRVQYDAALARWLSGDAVGCQRLLEEQLSRRPRQRDARLLLTDVYMITDQPDRALENARIAAGQFADDPQVLHCVGLTFEALDQDDEALDYFRRSFELDDQSEIIRLSYQNAVESASEATERQLQPSVVLVSDQPTTVGEAAWQQAIRTLVDASHRGDSRRVDSLVGKFLDRHEGQADILAQAGKSLLQCNQSELALHLLESAIERQTESSAVYRVVAMAYYRTGDYEASRRSLQFSLSLDKSSALSYFILGATFSKLGMSERAERSYRRSAEIDPRYSALR